MVTTEIQILEEPLKLHGNAKPIEYLVDPETRCWNTISHLPDSDGYIPIMRERKPMPAHRYSYELAYGPIPEGFFVCHHCDNPRCINPAHLFLGTPADNARDSMQKGRTTRGETNVSSKLTAIDVKAIRADRILSQRELGEKYGISENYIGLIKRGKRWRHLLLPVPAEMSGSHAS